MSQILLTINYESERITFWISIEKPNSIFLIFRKIINNDLLFLNTKH